jgi:hypothetical protein
VGCVPAGLGIVHKIPTGDAPPPQVPEAIYTRSPATPKRLGSKAQLQTLLDLGIISPSTSAWMSPVVLVKKPKSGELRLCLNFKKA